MVKNSDELFIGDMSVIQGSTLSCVLYLIYTLDLPLLFNLNKMTIEQNIVDKAPKSTTYVDDTTTTITLDDKTPKQTQIDTTITKLEDYMNSNFLTMNPTKTKLIIMSKNINLKNQLQINTTTKTIHPTPNFKYLGVMINQELKWNQHINDSKESLIKQMNTRFNSIKLLKKN